MLQTNADSRTESDKIADLCNEIRRIDNGDACKYDRYYEAWLRRVEAGLEVLPDWAK